MSQQQLLRRLVPSQHWPPLLWPMLPRPIPVGPALPRPVLRRPLLPQPLPLRPKTLCSDDQRSESPVVLRRLHKAPKSHGVRGGGPCQRNARQEEITVDSSAAAKTKRSQQTETLTRVRAGRSVAASPDGEQPLAVPLVIAAVILVIHWVGGGNCAPEYASGAQSVLLEGPAVATGRDTGNSHCEDTKGLPALHGFMVVRPWQWSSPRQTSSFAHEERMTSVLQQIRHKSTHLEILKHDVVSVAPLPELLLAEQLDLSRLLSGLGSKLADKAKDSAFTVIRHCSTSTCHCELNGFANLRTHWAGTVATGEPVYVWPLCTQLANHIVHGHWEVDLSAVLPRLDRKFWRAPVQPSVRQLKLIRANRPLANHSPDTDVASATSGPLHSTSTHKWHGAAPGVFDPEHMFRAVVDGKNFTNQKSVNETTQSSVRLGLPLQEKALEDALESQELQVPGRAILTTGRVRLDVVAMLASRELYSRRGLAMS